MSKRSTSSTREHVVLAFELYRRIPHRHKVTAKQLQAQLEAIGIVRDIRTIQRNLEIICEYFDIDKDDRNKPYGYIRRSPKPMSLGAQEALMLSLADHYLRNILPACMVKTLETAFRDAEYYLLPNGSNEKERQWLRKIHVVDGNARNGESEQQKEILEKVSTGLFHNRWLTIHIKGGEKSEPVDIMPFGLIQEPQGLNLVYKQELSDSEQVVSISNIAKATLWSNTFDFPVNYTLPSTVLSRVT